MVRFKNRYVLGRVEWFAGDRMELSTTTERGVGSSDIFRALRALVERTFGQFGFATIQASLQSK